MWQLHAIDALNLAHERAEEARRAHLAAEARAFAREERRRHGDPARRGALARLTVGVLRLVSGGLGSVADAACDAAARIEGGTAYRSGTTLPQR